MSFSRVFLCALIALPVATAGAQSSSADGYQRPEFAHEVSDLKSDARIVYGELPNGLRYAVMENDTPAQTASMRLRIAAGSLDEAEDELGLAHYLEHMAFNGSKNIPEGEMIKRLERHGLSFGADTNAHTSFDETVYKLNLPNVDDDVVDEAFMLMRETASNLTLSQGAIDRERGIIHSEKRTRNNAAFKRTIAEWEFYTRGSGLTDRLPIGTDETIDSVQADQFRAFYNANYHPEKAFFVFVGDLPAERVIAQIESTFGDWTGATNAAAAQPLPPVSMRPGDVGYYYDPEVMSSVTIAVLQPFEELPDGREKRRERLVAYLAMQMLWDRLIKLSHEPDSVIVSSSVSHGSMFDTSVTSRLTIRSEPDDWETALSIAEQQLRRALKFGFDQTEMDLQIDDLKRRYEAAAKTAGTPRTHGSMGSGMADRILGAYENERVLEDPRDSLLRLEQELETLTLEEVTRAFNEAWSGSESPMIYLSSAKQIENPETAVLNALQISRAVPVSQQERAELSAFAYTEFGSPGEIVEQAHLADVDAHVVRFANNVLLTVKQTDFVDDQILVAASVGDGAISLPRKDEGLRRLALNVLSQGGLEAHSSIELSDITASWEVGTRLFFSPASDTISLSGQSTGSDLPHLLNLLTAYSSAPGLREDAAKRYKRRLTAWYPTHDATPAGVASKEVPRIVRSGDARFGHPDLEGFLAPEWEEASSWLSAQLTQGMIEVAIVGDVPVETAIEEVARTFGALPTRSATRGKYPDATALTFPEREQDLITLTHAGEDDQALLRIYWPAPDGSDPMRSEVVRVLASVFRNRLVEEIREKDAAAYSPGVGRYSSPTFSDYGYLSVSLDLTPETVAPMISRVESVADELYRGEISDDLFERAMTPIREDLSTRLQSNGYWLSRLADSQSDKFGLAQHAAILAAPGEITVDDVKAMAREVFQQGRSVRIQVVPEPEQGT